MYISYGFLYDFMFFCSSFYYFRFIKLKVSTEIRKTENVMPNVIAQISKEWVGYVGKSLLLQQKF